MEFESPLKSKLAYAVSGVTHQGIITIWLAKRTLTGSKTLVTTAPKIVMKLVSFPTFHKLRKRAYYYY